MTKSSMPGMEPNPWVHTEILRPALIVTDNAPLLMQITCSKLLLRERARN